METSIIIKAINNLIAAIPVSCMEHDVELRVSIADARSAIRPTATEEDLLLALEELLGAVPSDDNDTCWWPDALTNAVEAAEALLK